MTRISHIWIFFFPNGAAIFQDDNFKIRRTQTAKEWFKERETSFSAIDRPPMSPTEILRAVVE